MCVVYFTISNCYYIKIRDLNIKEEILAWIEKVQSEQYLGEYFLLQNLRWIEGVLHFYKKRYQEKLTKQQVIEELECMWKISQSGKN